MRKIQFTVQGTPATQGSKKGFVDKTGHVRVKEDNKRNVPWRAQVAHQAALAMTGNPIFEGPVVLTLRFRLRRPKGHLGTGRNAGLLKDTAPDYPTTKPDLTKLVRCVEDALKGIVWKDDSQVVSYGGTGKQYALEDAPEGVEITIEEART